MSNAREPVAAAAQSPAAPTSSGAAVPCPATRETTTSRRVAVGRHLEVLGERAATVLGELGAASRGLDRGTLVRALAEHERVFAELPDADADALREMLMDLIDAMGRLGCPAREVSWRRARLHALRNDHEGVVAAAIEAHREEDRDWRMWLMAVPSYLSLGRRVDARMALSLLKELAPEEVVEGATVRELEAAVGGAASA